MHSTPVGVLVGIGVAVFAATLAAFAPASLALVFVRTPHFSYERAEGTVWRGVIRGVTMNAIPLGDTSFQLRPLALLQARLSGDFETSGRAVEASGRFSLGPGGQVSASDASVEVDLGRVRRYALLGSPLAGLARVRIDSLVTSRRGCRKAVATVWTNALESSAKRFNGAGFDLAGAVRCVDRHLIVDLSGSGAEGGARLELRITPGLTYSFEATAQPANADLEQALVYLGFERENGILTYAYTSSTPMAGS